MALFLEKTSYFVTLAAKIAIFLGQNMHLTSKTCVLHEKFVTHGLISREIRVTVLGGPYNYRRFFSFFKYFQTFPHYPIGGTKKSVFTADFIALAVKVAINVYFVWCDGRVA